LGGEKETTRTLVEQRHLHVPLRAKWMRINNSRSFNIHSTFKIQNKGDLVAADRRRRRDRCRHGRGDRWHRQKRHWTMTRNEKGKK